MLCILRLRSEPFRSLLVCSLLVALRDTHHRVQRTIIQLESLRLVETIARIWHGDGK